MYIENFSYEGNAGKFDYMTTARFGECIVKIDGIKALLVELTT